MNNKDMTAAAEITTLKEENRRLLRELSDAHSRIVDLEAGEEILKARVSELEFALRQSTTSMLDSGYNPKSVVIRAAMKALKELANEG